MSSRSFWRHSRSRRSERAAISPRTPSAPAYRGQVLGQAIVAAQLTQPEKEVKTVHTIFARVGRAAQAPHSKWRRCTRVARLAASL